jgi:hypothetical protein
MRKVFVVTLAVAFSVASLVADVTVTQTMTMEGQAAAMMQGTQLPRITMRIKGRKSRSDMEVNGQTFTAIADVDARQVIILNAATKTATVTTPASVAAGGAPVAIPKMDISLKPTGKSQTIDGQACDEHSFSMTIAMGEMMGQAQLPPEAAAALKDVRMLMTGSFWVAKSAPGAAEFAAYNKAVAESKLMSAVAGAMPGMSGGLDKLIEAAASAPGLPYLTEMTMTFDGTGPMVDAMKQMGPMKMVQKIASVSTAALPDDLFRIPEGYTVEKK